MSHDTLTFTRDGFDEHRWTVKAANGDTVDASTEGYVHRHDAEANAHRHRFLEPTSDPDVYVVVPPLEYAARILDTEAHQLELQAADLIGDGDHNGAHRTKQAAAGLQAAAEHLRTHTKENQP